MKTITLIVSMLLFCCVYSGTGLDTKLINYNFEGKGFWDYDYYQGKMALLIVDTDYPGYSFKPAVTLFENGEWKKLPGYVGNDTMNKILPSDNSQIHFDSSGNIWICGYSLYKYDGNKWNEYRIVGDTLREYRHFRQFCIDKYNNIWITSFIRVSSSEVYSEFFKFDGKKFISIFKFPTFLRLSGIEDFMATKVLSAMPDGRVVLHCIVTVSDDDFNNGDYKDVYIFNQDMTAQRLRLPSASSFEASKYTRAVSSIYTEEDGKIWFTLGRYSWGGILGYEPGSCCSGITLYNKGEWVLFDQSNGLDTMSKDLYAPIFRIAKLSNGSYFLVGRNSYYIMDSNNNMKLYHWDDFFNKAEFMVSNSNNYGDKAYEYLSNFLPYPPPMGYIETVQSVFAKDGKIFIGTYRGILIAKESDVLALDVAEETTLNMVLYPNPAEEYINIPTIRNYSTYQIMNLLGMVVGSGIYSDNRIPVSDLPSGAYFVKLYGLNNTYTLNSFIKK
jgi:hypothetical protein